jgi:hypothetical protein
MIVYVQHGDDPRTMRGYRIVFDIMLEEMESANSEWSSIISHWDDLSEASPDYPKLTLSKKFMTNFFKKWLAGDGSKTSFDIDQESILQQKVMGKATLRFHERHIVRLNTADIPRCTNCLLPIALMKKCRGCRKTKFVSPFFLMLGCFLITSFQVL